jgi:acyl carrier protein
VLAGLPGVRHAAVLTTKRGPDSGRPNFVAYFVPSDESSAMEIMEQLRAKLPEHALPSALVRLDRPPITDSGELDAPALPDPEVTDADCYLAPRNALDYKVRGIIADVLGYAQDAIGVRDDFFGLGGNSILAIRLVTRLSEELNADIGIDALLLHQTIAELVDSLADGTGPAAVIPRLDPLDETEQPLSFAQQSLWFIDRYEQGTNAYNVQLLYDVLPGTDLDVLESSVRAVYERHEALRTVIKEDFDCVPYQSVLDVQVAPLAVERITVDDLATLRAEVEREAKTRFNLAEQAPFRARYYLIGTGVNQEVAIEFLLHHISFDGWSADLLLTELGEFYDYFSRLAAGEAAILNVPELSIRYRDYAAWQRREISGAKLGELVTYWRSTLDGAPPLELPTDRPRPKSIEYRGASIMAEFDRDFSAALRFRAKSLGVSLFSLLLTGWYLALSRFSGQDKFVVGVPVANRRQAQTRDLIGCFVNSLAIYLHLEGGSSIAAAVTQVADWLKQAQQHQDLPFERLVGELAPVRDISCHPIFQVWFDVHSFAETEADHDGRGSRGKPSAPLRTHALDERRAAGDRETIARFDLSAVINDGQDAMTCTFTYPVGIFDRSTVERLVQEYQVVLAQLGERPPVTTLSELWHTTSQRDIVKGSRAGRG